MKAIQTARLAWLTRPRRGEFVLNVQPLEGNGLLRFSITRNQLCGIVREGVDELVDVRAMGEGV